MFYNNPLFSELLEKCVQHKEQLEENIKTVFATYFDSSVEYLQSLNVSCDYLPVYRESIVENSVSVCSAIAGILLFVTVLLIFRLCKSKPKAKLPGEDISFEYCKSPDCVRCAKYKDILKVSYKRFHQYLKSKAISLHSVDGLSYKRIQISFQELGFEKGHETTTDKKSMLPYQKPNVFVLANMSSRPFWDDVYRIDMRNLEKCFDSIRLEFERAFNLHDCKQMKYWTRNSTATGNWSVLSLVNQGNPVSRNVELCPITWSAIQSLRCFMRGCVFGNVVFSVVYPDTVISEHCGPTNTRIRCHLALQVPEGCSMTVNGLTRSWKEGSCLLFDDSYPHSVHYEIGKKSPSAEGDLQSKNTVYSVDKSKLRAVLMVDLWHPWLTEQERQALAFSFSSSAIFSLH